MVHQCLDLEPHPGFQVKVHFDSVGFKIFYKEATNPHTLREGNILSLVIFTIEMFYLVYINVRTCAIFSLGFVIVWYVVSWLCGFLCCTSSASLISWYIIEDESSYWKLWYLYVYKSSYHKIFFPYNLGDALEIGVQWSILKEDIPSFERYMAQLKPYYLDYK